MILQFLLNGLVNGSLIALVALGFSLVYNTSRIFHIAYAGIYVWAAYILYICIEFLHLGLLWSFLISITAAALLSLLCNELVYQFLQKRGKSANTLMISSVGILIILISLAEMAFGNAGRYTGELLSGSIQFSGLYLSNMKIFSMLIVWVIMAGFFFWLNRSSLGIQLRSLRDNEILSAIFGVNTTRLKSLLFIISGVMIAVASSVSMLDVGITPHVGLPVFINAFVALLIGGIGRFDGPVLGGIFLGLLQALTEFYFDSRWVMMVTFVLLFVFLLLRPQGIIPSRSRIV